MGDVINASTHEISDYNRDGHARLGRDLERVNLSVAMGTPPFPPRKADKKLWMEGCMEVYNCNFYLFYHEKCISG